MKLNVWSSTHSFYVIHSVTFKTHALRSRYVMLFARDLTDACVQTYKHTQHLCKHFSTSLNHYPLSVSVALFTFLREILGGSHVIKSPKHSYGER